LKLALVVFVQLLLVAVFLTTPLRVGTAMTILMVGVS